MNDMPDTSTRRQWFLKKFCFLCRSVESCIHSRSRRFMVPPVGLWGHGGATASIASASSATPSSLATTVAREIISLKHWATHWKWYAIENSVLGHTATFQTFSLQVDLCVRLVESSSRIRILLKRKFWLLVQYLPEKTLVLFFCWYKKTPFLLLLLFLIIRPIFSYNVSYTKVF